MKRFLYVNVLLKVKKQNNFFTGMFFSKTSIVIFRNKYKSKSVSPLSAAEKLDSLEIQYNKEENVHTWCSR